MNFKLYRRLCLLSLTVFTINLGKENLANAQEVQTYTRSEITQICVQGVCRKPNTNSQDSSGRILNAETDSFNAEAEIDRALEIYRAGNKQESLNLLQNIIRNAPNYALAYFNAGNVLFDLKRYDESIAYFTRATEINPNYASAYLNLGSAFYVQALQGKGTEKQSVDALNRARVLFATAGNLQVLKSIDSVLILLGDAEAIQRVNDSR